MPLTIFIHAILTILVLPLLLVGLSTPGLGAVGLFCTVAILARVVRRPRSDAAVAMLFGAALVLTPWMGGGVLLALAFIFLWFHYRAIRPLQIAWMLPWFGLLAVWCVSDLLFADALPVRFMAYADPALSPLTNLHLWLASSPPVPLVRLYDLARVWLMLILFQFLATDAAARRSIVLGIAAGLSGFAILVILSFTPFDPGPLSSQQLAYWSLLRRVGFSFSDPNACGLFMALAIPLLVPLFRRDAPVRALALAAIVAAMTIGGAIAGSRSFFLGLGVYALVLLIRKGGWRVTCGVALILIAGVAALNATIFREPQLVERVSQYSVGLGRLVEAASISHVSEALASRTIFWQIGTHVWFDHLLLGVGFGHFREFVSYYVHSLNLGIGLWNDNSNSFYLGVLAELGVLGLVALLMTFSALRWRTDASLEHRCARAGVVALLVLLAVGPHLDFDEIALLAAVGASGALTVQRRMRFSGLTFFVMAVAAAVIGAKSFYRERGFYAWEQEGADFFRWTGSRAHGFAECDAAGNARIEVRAARLGAHSQKIVVRAPGPVPQERMVDFAADDSAEIQFSCGGVAEKHLRARWLPYTLTVGSPWVPRVHGLGADSRLLGVRVLENAPRAAPF